MKKKSATGRVAVVPDTSNPGQLRLIDSLTVAEELKTGSYNLLQPIFNNGVVLNELTLSQIRNTIST